MTPLARPRVAVSAPASRHGTTGRFRLLADSVREHQRAAEQSGRPLSERDRALHERLRQLESSLPF
jgi:hypothetical protein